MASLSDMLAYLRKRENLSQQELADKLDMTRSAIGMYETGKREPDLETLEIFADFFNVDMNTLTGSKPPANFVPFYKNIIPVPNTYTVPLVGTIACGQPIVAVEYAEELVEVPDHIRADFALRCKGDSMINARIFDGDIVYIRKQPTVDNGDIAAVCVDDEATLKKVQIFDDHIALLAENPTYAPLVYWYEEMDTVHILGKAVAFTSSIR